MPANLTPQYLEAERNFRMAKTTLEKIACLEEMLSIMPKHKGTDHLRADLRTKIAKLTQSLDKKTATQRASMMIEKMGAGQLAVIGPPNSGKSQIVASLTKATPTVASYPFTTQNATPGMMAYENIKIQLIDTPPLSEQPPEWWILNIIRRADALLIVIDLSNDPLSQLETIIDKLLEKKMGLWQIEPADEELLVTVKKALVVCNKKDLDVDSENFNILKEIYGDRLKLVAISAQGRKLDELRLAIFRLLDIIRIYTKVPGGKPDYEDPIVLPTGSTLEEAAASVHKDFARKMKYARIWGSGKHDGVMASRDHVLQDGDVIEVHV
ncbi:MAG TPA: TGS domain-containing protein [Dehalococcoidia bacterium]|nr:TGS domain-containing protein [Dehalococcoidia bacterium]